MLLPLYLLVIFVSTFTKNKKFNWILYALFFCFLMWSSNGEYADFEGYKYIFNLINNGTSAISLGASNGFYALCKITGLIGLNYYGMTLVMAFLSCLLLHSFFLKFDANENVIWGALLAFPLLINGIQIKFFLSMAIVCFGLRFLLFDKKFPMIKYTVCVLIAASIHTASLVFLILLLVLIYDKFGKKTNIIISILVLAFSIFCVQMLPNIASLILYSSQYNRYFGGGTQSSSLKQAFAITACWGISLFLLNMIKGQTSVTIKKSLEYSILYKRMFYITLVLGITLFLLVFDRSFHRFIEMGYIMDAVLLGIYWKHPNLKMGKNQKYAVFLIYILCLTPAIYSYEFIPTNAIKSFFEIIGFPSIFG